MSNRAVASAKSTAVAQTLNPFAQRILSATALMDEAIRRLFRGDPQGLGLLRAPHLELPPSTLLEGQGEGMRTLQHQKRKGNEREQGEGSIKGERQGQATELPRVSRASGGEKP